MVQPVGVSEITAGPMLTEGRLHEVIGGAIPKRRALLVRNPTGKVAPPTATAPGLDHVAIVGNIVVSITLVEAFVDR